MLSPEELRWISPKLLPGTGRAAGFSWFGFPNLKWGENKIDGRQEDISEWLKMYPAASVPTERILVKPPCLNPLFGWDQDLTCHLGEVLQECFPCSRNMILSLLNLVAFRHSTSCPFPDLPSRLLAELLVSVLVPRCGCREGVSMLQLLLQCQHTNLYCLWFLKKILVLCSS